MFENLIYLTTIIITISIPLWYIIRNSRQEDKSRQELADALQKGLTEPASLHPKIDPSRCIGSGACVKVCPEGDILGLISGVGKLVTPTKCIGHGACQQACPVDAIDLVFGTEKRGIEIPFVKETFETNIDGLFIAGELGGMGLIRNAITQGTEAIDYISQTLQKTDSKIFDVAIIGAGPAGIAATLQAKKLKLNYLCIEQDDVGGAILSYPRQKLVMTQPMVIPFHGKFDQKEIRKEQLIALWQHIIRKSGISIHTFEKLEQLEQQKDHFQIKTSKGEYQTRRVLLAIGRRGTPRKLNVPGERSQKVAYKLIDPEQYRNKAILVVGGGDSAVETAISLAEQPGTEVTISYRRNTFSRIKADNRRRIEHAERDGRVTFCFNSTVSEIHPSNVNLTRDGKGIQLMNDYVFICAGGELPTALLQKVGIKIEKKFGEK